MVESGGICKMVIQQFKKTIVFDYLQIIVGAALVGLAFNIFFLPARLAAGGVSGISTILYELFLFNPAYVQWLINIPLLILGVVLVGKEFEFKNTSGDIFCAICHLANVRT